MAAVSVSAPRPRDHPPTRRASDGTNTPNRDPHPPAPLHANLTSRRSILLYRQRFVWLLPNVPPANTTKGPRINLGAHKNGGTDVCICSREWTSNTLPGAGEFTCAFSFPCSGFTPAPVFRRDEKGLRDLSRGRRCGSGRLCRSRTRAPRGRQTWRAPWPLPSCPAALPKTRGKTADTNHKKKMDEEELSRDH